MFQGKKITKTTLKSFVKKNAGSLYIRTKSSFNGMTDGVDNCDGGFVKAEATEDFLDHSLGVKGLWLVNRSDDYFTAYKDNQFVGIEVYNSCGTTIVAIKG